MRAILVLSLLLSSAAGGCFFLIGAGAGAGGYSYISGELRRNYDAGIDKTWTAAFRAVGSLKLKVIDKRKDGLGGKIKAERADGSKIVIRLKVTEAGGTNVGVRAGLVGNKVLSERIHKRIAKYLK